MATEDGKRRAVDGRGQEKRHRWTKDDVVLPQWKRRARVQMKRKDQTKTKSRDEEKSRGSWDFPSTFSNYCECCESSGMGGGDYCIHDGCVIITLGYVALIRNFLELNGEAGTVFILDVEHVVVALPLEVLSIHWALLP
ncbi:hypothetical protein U1Q18_030900 [Sarracenia purpurea var. burkii]